MHLPSDVEGAGPRDPRGAEQDAGVEQDQPAPPAPSPDGVEEQSRDRILDEEGAGLAAKE